MQKLPLPFLAILPLLLVAADGAKPAPKAADLDPAIKKADDAFEETVKHANEGARRLIAEAAKKRMQAYDVRLKFHTKEGDFDRAKAVKDAMEALIDSGDALRPLPKNIEKSDNHKYAIVCQGGGTWHVSKRRCEEMGGHLLIINTPREYEFIKQMAAKHPGMYWIGATDEEQEGKWMWVDGSPAGDLGRHINNANGNENFLSWSTDLAAPNDTNDGRACFICEWD